MFKQIDIVVTLSPLGRVLFIMYSVDNIICFLNNACKNVKSFEF